MKWIALFLAVTPLLSTANGRGTPGPSCRGRRMLPPNGVCARIYDDENCGGKGRDIYGGYAELATNIGHGPMMGAVESVVVRPGCTFVGKEQDCVVGKRG